LLLVGLAPGGCSLGRAPLRHKKSPSRRCGRRTAWTPGPRAWRLS